MSAENILRLRELLQARKEGSFPEAPKEMSKTEEKRVVKEVIEKAEDLHSRLGMLREVLTKGFKNRLLLGKDPEQINWDLMSGKIAACFKPEFGFQPEDITDFYISVEEVPIAGTRQVSLKLDRRNRWWSQLSLGAIVRKDYIGGSSYLQCNAPTGQKREAREAMEALESYFWGDEVDCLRDRMLKRDVRELDLLEEFLGFVVGETERQIEQTPA